MTFQIGEVVRDRYRIVQVLASGGMGIVYRAKDESLGIDVALKVSFAGTIPAERFRQNAECLSGLHHPAIPRITDTFEAETGEQVLVMDYIPGDDLKTRVEKNGPIKLREAIQIILTVGSALNYLHRQTIPVIHQDVKPGNIRITPDGKPILIDFDLSAAIQENQTRPPLSEIGFTPGFAAPEQYNNMGIPASDQYGLAATLFYLLTATTIPDGLSRASGTTHLPEYTGSRIPLDIYTCLEKALRINPADRYPDIQSFMNALSAVASEKTNINVDTTRRIQRRKNRTKMVVLLAIFASVIITGLFIGFNLFEARTSLIKTEPTDTKALITVEPTIQQTVGLFPTEELEPIPSSVPTGNLPADVLPTPLGGGSGEYAYVNENTGVPQIYIASTGLGNSIQITTVPDGACQPDWSPDGRRIVFISPCQPKNRLSGKSEPYANSGLFIINVDSRQVIPIPSKPGGDFDPAWSPDGTQIAYTTIRNKVPQIFTYDFATENSQELTQAGIINRQPAWSPDGSRIAYSSNMNGSLQIWIMKNDQSEAKAFSIQVNGAAFTADWSPDGKSIVYSQTNSYRLVKQGYGLSSPSENILNPQIHYANNPDFSPDGYWILFDSNMSGTNRIYRVTRDGAGVEPLTPEDEKSYQPVWKPAN